MLYRRLKHELYIDLLNSSQHKIRETLTLIITSILMSSHHARAFSDNLVGRSVMLIDADCPFALIYYSYILQNFIGIKEIKMMC
jgi:hypothetical protein